MSDPLSLIRQAKISATPIEYVDHNYIFGPYKLHESTKTCFKRTLKADDVYYTLRDVLFFLDNSEVGVGEYRRLCVEMRVNAVVESDKQNLKAYVSGEIDSCPQLDATVAAATSVKQPTPETTSQPQISAEQRQRHAALIEQSMQKSSTIGVASSSATISGVSAGKMDEIRLLRRAQKRKAVQMSSTGDNFDPSFIAADRILLAKLRADETPAQTRNSVLCRPAADFTFVLKLFNDYVLRPKGAQAPAPRRPIQVASATLSTATAAGAKPAQSNDVAMESSGSQHRFQVPIIIVPATTSSIISKANAVDLLQHGRYVPIEEKVAASGYNKDERTVVHKTHASSSIGAGFPVEYKIVDNPATQMRPEDWDRVVAVFATGQAWQFKDFKWSNPVELFQNVLGFHLTMDDRVVHSNVQNWNCKVLKINQFKRHMDASAINEFWAALESFARLHKPWLLQAPPGMQRPAERGIGASPGNSHSRKVAAK